MVKISKQDTKKIIKLFNIDTDVVSFDELQYGLNVELEHGTAESLTNVTNDDLVATAKIAIAHLLEYPDYYKRLKKMENDAEKYWKTKEIPCIFNGCKIKVNKEMKKMDTKM